MIRLILVLSLLAGCAAPKLWYRDGSTRQQYDMEIGQCQAQGYAVPGAGSEQTHAVINACMRGKGWVLR